MTSKNVAPPSMSVPMSSSVAASCMMVCAFFTALGSPPFLCAVVIFLAVPVMLLSSVYQWLHYFRKYIDFRICELASNAEEN